MEEEDQKEEELEVPQPPRNSRRKSLFDSSVVRNLAGKNEKKVQSKHKSLQSLGEEDEEETVDDEEERIEDENQSDIASAVNSRAEEEEDDGEQEEGAVGVQDGALGQDAKKSKKQDDNAGGLEDQLTNEKLRQLEEIFSEADEDGGGGLDMEEFRKAMRTQLGGKLTDADLDKIFMKVDTNCDGTVDWDEYLTYMLLECKGQDTMSLQSQQPYPKYVSAIRSPHRDSIICILLMSSGRKDSTDPREGIYGRYISVGQDGIICIWTTSMNLLASHRIQPEGKQVWVTDAAYISGVQEVVVSSTSRELFLYDVSGNRFQLTRRITNLNSCALALHFWNNYDSRKLQFTDGKFVKAILLWGDSSGSLATVFFHTEPYTSALCGKFEQKNNRKQITFQELLQDKIPGMSANYREQLHGDLIRQVMFCPNLCSTISCCKESDTAMFVGGIGSKLINSYFKVKKGIDTFDYGPSLNVIVTGGYDGLVRIWNPYVPAKPVIRLDGHQFPVQHVRIDTVLENVVSISEIKEIRVHDLSTQVCIQTIYKKMVLGLGPRSVTAFYLNQGRQNLVFATNTLATLEQKEEENIPVELSSHEKAISHALFNPLFEQVVSIGADSSVCVWAITNGSKVMQFKAHQVRRNGEMKDVEVTAMTFDPTFRRLITAAKNGDVRIWNFNNGACLRVLPKFDNTEITSLSCPNHNILTAGWNRRVTKYVDSADDDSVRWLKLYHRDDILSISHYNGNVLASGSYDGNILVWSLATGRLLFCLNGNISDKQIRAATYFKSEIIKDDTPENGVSPKDRNDMSNNSPRIETQDKCVTNNAVQKLLFLESRESDAETATLLAACADGQIQAWSLHHLSGLLGTFPAAHLKDTSVNSMVTDEENILLITADSGGYVKVFDMSNYCTSGWEEQEQDETYIAEREELHKTFPFIVWSQMVLEHSHSGMQSWTRRYMTEGNNRPPMMNSFRAHLQSITSLDLVTVKGSTMLLTASLDQSVRLWSIQGQFIGIFGQPDLWDLRMTFPRYPKEMADIQATGVYRHRKVLLPPDIRRVGSAATLMVLNGGRRPAWKLCSNVIKWLFRPPKVDEQSKSPQRANLEKVSSIKSVSKECEYQPSILGSNFTRLTRHHPLPSIPLPRFNGITEVLSVYGSLQYHQLVEVEHPEMPDSLKVIQRTKKKQMNAHRLFTEAASIQKKLKGIKAFRNSIPLVQLMSKKSSHIRTDISQQENGEPGVPSSASKKEIRKPSNSIKSPTKSNTNTAGTGDLSDEGQTSHTSIPANNSAKLTVITEV